MKNEMTIETTDIGTKKADKLAHEVYKITRNFPREELYGLTSQLRRAVLSVVLNIIEGFARQGKKEHKRFLGIAYGSLKETKYLIIFCHEEKLIKTVDFKILIKDCNEVAKILWVKIQSLK